MPEENAAASMSDRTPESYDDLHAQILERHARLSKQLQKIARFAIDSPEVVALESVYSVARSAGVQPSAIVRFAQAFGLDGFGDLQRLFRQNLVASKNEYLERIRKLERAHGGGSIRLLDEFAQASIRALERMQLEISQDRIEAAVSLLRGADEIFLLGQRRSFAVAQYLNYALSRLARRNTLVTGAGGMIDAQLARCRPALDVVLAVSFAPYSQEVVDRVASLADAGTQIVAITDSPLSPLASISTVYFEVSGGDHAFRSLVAPICLAQTIVVALGQQPSP